MNMIIIAFIFDDPIAFLATDQRTAHVISSTLEQALSLHISLVNLSSPYHPKEGFSLEIWQADRIRHRPNFFGIQTIHRSEVQTITELS